MRITYEQEVKLVRMMMMMCGLDELHCEYLYRKDTLVGRFYVEASTHTHTGSIMHRVAITDINRLLFLNNNR